MTREQRGKATTASARILKVPKAQFVTSRQVMEGNAARIAAKMGVQCIMFSKRKPWTCAAEGAPSKALKIACKASLSGAAARYGLTGHSSATFEYLRHEEAA